MSYDLVLGPLKDPVRVTEKVGAVGQTAGVWTSFQGAWGSYLLYRGGHTQFYHSTTLKVKEKEYTEIERERENDTHTHTHII